MRDGISLTAAAARLRRSYSQVLRLVLIGELKGWQEGGRWKVELDDVDRFARAVQVEASRRAGSK